jgi:oligopeptide/dipeptide ABC transporter ATP-binding protein
MSDKEVLLSVQNLQQYFKLGKHELKAVDKVSFDVYKGEVFGLVGESGCGKTTTGRSIIRLYDITGGSVYYKGERICAGTRSYKDAIAAAKKKLDAGEITKEEYEAEVAHNRAEIKAAQADHKKWARTKGKNQLTNEIQMIFQDPDSSLDPRMTVRDIIAEGLIIRGIKDKAYIDEQVYKILETVGLVREHANRYPHEFSGGQKQRIGIARALIMEPEFIIADEPISALDVSVRAQVLNLMRDLQKQREITYLFIAHDLSVMRYITDRIAVIHKGDIVEMGNTEDVITNPIHPYTKALLSAIPMPDPAYEKNKELVVFNPLYLDYEENPPSWVEVEPGHFILANQIDLKEWL